MTINEIKQNNGLTSTQDVTGGNCGPSTCSTLIGYLGVGINELLADVSFLAARCAASGSCSLSDDERDYGMSSNSMVAIAYGLTPLANQCMPGDNSDLRACERMWQKLPVHRKTADAIEAMRRAKLSLSDNSSNNQ